VIDTDCALIPSTPVICYIELTYDCNNRCPDCSTSYCQRFEDNPLTINDWETVLRKLAPQVSYVCLTGGEPTLYRGLAQIISLIQRLNTRYALFTNGRWPDPLGLIDSLRASANLIQIFFSLQGADPASHDDFTGVAGSFEETYHNITLCSRAGLPVTIDTVITSKNYNHIEELVDLSQELNAGSITFSRYLTSKGNAFAPSNSELHLALDTVERLRTSGKWPVFVSVCIPQCFHQSDSSGPCLAGTISVVVDPWGNVRPCVMVPLTVGNLLSDSLNQVWWHPSLEAWRAKLPALCKNCAALSRCGGGCRAAAINRKSDQDYLMGDPLKTPLPSVPTQITLQANLRPFAEFTSRPEPFGYILMFGTNVVPVTEKALPLLQACNGIATLEEILATYGQDGLDFIALLYSRGLITMQ
jgi:radical SAM protein with 4Fe4S-binding SPASM domain